MNSRLKILMVSAEPFFWASAEAWLEEADYTVFQATNGRSAVALFRQELPCIVLVDNAWPQGSQSLCRALKSEATAFSPFVILATPNGEALAETDDLDDFLPLPLSKKALLLKIRLAERLVRAEKLQLRLPANGPSDDFKQVKSNFAANVSHELRLPLNNLMLYLDLMQKGSHAKRATYEAQLATNIERINNLVTNILELSQLEARVDTPPLLPVDINLIIAEAVAVVSAGTLARPVPIHFEPNDQLPPAHGRRDQLIQVMTNLLTNALKHTVEGEIRIQARRQIKDYTICISVKDTGVGILPEDLPNIFERFYRGQQSGRYQAPGSGLGLAIVREIVDQHDGRITVESTPGKGSIFTICLPAAPL